MQKAKMLSLATILSLATAIPNAYAVKNGEVFKDWKGQCETVNDKELCTVSQAALDSEGRPQTAVIIGKVGDSSNLAARVIVPLLVNLRAGIKLAVDGSEVARTGYSYCDPIGCSAIIDLDEKLTNKLKGGSKLTVTFIDMRGETTYPVSLSGVTKAINEL